VRQIDRETDYHALLWNTKYVGKEAMTIHQNILDCYWDLIWTQSLTPCCCCCCWWWWW